MNAIIKDAPVEKGISARNTGNEVLQPTAGRAAIVDMPAQISQQNADINSYRWNQNPINPPVEALLYRAGQCVGTGKICSIGIHGMFVETTDTFAKDMFGMYVQVQFALHGEQGYSRFCLDGRVAHSFDTGVALLMDVLYPVTSRGLEALLKQTTTSASVLH